MAQHLWFVTVLIEMVYKTDKIICKVGITEKSYKQGNSASLLIYPIER